mmetsp:Transcript_29845/g.63299  ORF Transcript_29845/g.63299 Transcript_29845/m.63299 type:complete len:294 (-) Transcript_29845:579-1460(-)
MLLHKRHDSRDNRILDSIRNQRQASRPTHAQIPLIIINLHILILLRQRFHQQRTQMFQCRLDIPHAHTLRGRNLTRLRQFSSHVHQFHLLFRQGRPEFNGLERNALLVATNGVKSQLEQRLHVVRKLVVVLKGNLDKALVRRGTDTCIQTLGGITNGFHDHVALILGLHILTGKRERVPERLGGSIANGIRTIRSDPINNGGQHEVGNLGTNFGSVPREGEREGNPLARKSQTFQGRNLDTILHAGPRHIFHQCVQEFRPFLVRQFDRCNFRTCLCCRVSRDGDRTANRTNHR